MALPDGVVAEIIESVFAGLWRIRFLGADNGIIADYAEVSAVPQAIRRAAAMTLPRLDLGALPEGVMNAPAVLAEIADRAEHYQFGEPNHIVSLTLLPMFAGRPRPSRRSARNRTGGKSSRAVMGVAAFKRRQSTTSWSVQFFNAMDAILLDTIEIGDVPAAAQAARGGFPRLGRPSSRNRRGLFPMTDSSEDRWECGVCWTVYDPVMGDDVAQIPPGTSFQALPNDWCCPTATGQSSNS